MKIIRKIENLTSSTLEIGGINIPPFSSIVLTEVTLKTIIYDNLGLINSYQDNNTINFLEENDSIINFTDANIFISYYLNKYETFRYYTDESNDASIKDRGPHQIDLYYYKNDLVTFNNILYKCIKNHISIENPSLDSENWDVFSNIQGPQGNQGFQGNTGNQGDQGDIGPQGNQGFQGDQGDIGPQGNQGFQGDQGDIGPQGNQGFQGNIGPQGNQGFQGNIGPQGNQGFQGDQGTQGNQGFQGDQGTQGNTGPQGDQGTQGFQGFQGNTGPQGDQGTQGNTGPQGTQGFQGIKGDQGDIGPQGDQGTQGFQGIKGDQGNTGPQGTQGLQGDTAGPALGWSDFDDSDVTITNSTVETTILSKILPANTLNANGQMVEFIAFGNVTCVTTARALTLRFKNNGTNIYVDATGNLTASAASRSVTLVCKIVRTSSTTADLIFELWIGQAAAATTGTGDLSATSLRACAARSTRNFTCNFSQNNTISTSIQLGVASTEFTYFHDAVNFFAPGGTGPQGPQGNNGAQGPQGFQGSIGPQGNNGAQGPQGFQGAASTVPGPQGPQGNNGAQGPQGFQGASGSAGNHGITVNTVPLGNDATTWKNSSIVEETSVINVGKRQNVTTTTDVAITATTTDAASTWKKIFQVLAPNMTAGQRAQFVFGRGNQNARIAEFAFFNETLDNDCRMTLGLYGVPELLAMYYDKRIRFDVDSPTGNFGINGMKATNNMPNIFIDPTTGNFSRSNFFTNIKEYSGFLNNDNISMSYSQANRQITLTGDLTYYRNGQEIVLTSPWTSPVHGTANGSWYLYDNGSGIVWSQTPWQFSDVQVAYVWYGTSATLRFALREMHGILHWIAHRNDHQTRGLYRVSGGDLNAGSYTLTPASPVDTNNRPTWSQCVVQDEDLTTTIPAGTGSGSYTKLYFDASNNPVFAVNQTHLIITTGNYASYNNNGVLTAIPSGNFANIYTMVLPAASDDDSQKFRTILVYGTSIYSTKELARMEDLRSLRLEGIPNLSPESVLTNQITIRVDDAYTTTGKFRIESIQRISIERYTVEKPASTSAGAVTDPGDAETFNIVLGNYTQTISQLIWSSMVFVTKPGKINRMSIFVTQATGSGNTRLGIYDSNHELVAQSNNKTNGLSTGFNEFIFNSDVVLTTQSYYYFTLQSRANGAILLGYNATINPNTPVLARLDSNNAADPLNGMTTPITVSQSQYRLWIRAYYVG